MPTVGTDDPGGQRQSQADVAGTLVRRGVDAVERLE